MDANIKTPQDALEWIERCIHEKAEMDGELTNEHAIQLAFIQNMLAKFPRRNCDVGSAEEQSDRMDAVYCSKRLCAKGKCPLFKPGGDCSLIWAQMPYEAEKGGAK